VSARALDGSSSVFSPLELEAMIDSAIPNYLRFPVAEPAEIQDELRRLNHNAIRYGWRQSLDDFHGFHGDEASKIRYLTDPAHHKFVDLLPLTRESTVLELGASLGQITTALAARAGFVHALEVVPGQAEFAAERCRQEGFSNVAVTCGGDDCRFPYSEDAQFDGVVVNLVLEWCGQRDPSTPFLESQRRLLRECVRVLKPGGWFFITTKNRFGLRYLIGRGDEHTHHWPFGQALPRWLLALLLRLRGKSGPDGLIHSHGAMRRLLQEAGLTDLRSFWAYPDFRFPREYVPADSASIRAARRRPGFVQPEDSRSARLLMPLIPAPLVKPITPGLVFLAEKPA
jgi:SAM-dependent methyltransferase